MRPYSIRMSDQVNITEVSSAALVSLEVNTESRHLVALLSSQSFTFTFYVSTIVSVSDRIKMLVVSH